MLARVRINVPDRPGMLGRVASAIGSAGADIVKVDVLENESSRAVDDVFVEVRDVTHLTRVSDALSGVVGLRVIGLQHPAPPVSGHADLELLSQVLAHPERGLRTLVDGAPGALGADWGAMVAFRADGELDQVVAASVRAPGLDGIAVRSSLRLGAVRITPPGSDVPYGGAALVPLGDHPLGLLLVRETGPEFHRFELWRLGQVGNIAAVAVQPVPQTGG